MVNGKNRNGPSTPSLWLLYRRMIPPMISTMLTYWELATRPRPTKQLEMLQDPVIGTIWYEYRACNTYRSTPYRLISTVAARSSHPRVLCAKQNRASARQQKPPAQRGDATELMGVV